MWWRSRFWRDSSSLCFLVFPCVTATISTSGSTSSGRASSLSGSAQSRGLARPKFALTTPDLSHFVVAGVCSFGCVCACFSDFWGRCGNRSGCVSRCRSCAFGRSSWGRFAVVRKSNLFFLPKGVPATALAAQRCSHRCPDLVGSRSVF